MVGTLAPPSLSANQFGSHSIRRGRQHRYVSSSEKYCTLDRLYIIRLVAKIGLICFKKFLRSTAIIKCRRCLVAPTQGVTKRCRLSLLTNSAPHIRVQIWNGPHPPSAVAVAAQLQASVNSQLLLCSKCIQQTLITKITHSSLLTFTSVKNYATLYAST